MLYVYNIIPGHMEVIRLGKITCSPLAPIVNLGRIFRSSTMVELSGTEKKGKKNSRGRNFRGGNGDGNEKNKFSTLSCVPWS